MSALGFIVGAILGVIVGVFLAVIVFIKGLEKFNTYR